MGKVLDDRSFHSHIHSRFHDHFCLHAEVEIQHSSSPAELLQVVHLLSVVIRYLPKIKEKEQLENQANIFFGQGNK